MSGIEVAGLVLGAYPVLASFYNVYKDVFNGLEGWRAFRGRFEDFALSLETERLCYRDTLKSLLCLGSNPFVQSIEEADEILSDSDQTIWRSDELAENLRQRLGERYEACILIIGKLNGVMTELYRLLDIERGETSLPDNRSASWWQEKFDRTRFSFSTKRIRKISQLKVLNEDLDRLVRNTDQLGRLRTSAYPSAFASFFKKVRENASGLHDAVKGAWTCNCSNRHTIRLRLEKRAEGEETSFVLQYHEQESNDRNIKVMICNASENKASKDSESTGRSVSFAKTAANTPPSSNPSDKKKIAAPNTSSEKNKSIMKPKKPRTRYAAPLWLFNTLVALSRSGTDHSSLFFRKKQSIEALPVPGPAAKQPPQTYPKPSAPSPTNEKVINDLCLVIHSPWQHPHLLRDSVREYRFMEGQAADSMKATTLRSLLDQKLLTKKQRVRLASVLASSLLQLEKTPWLANGWGKDEIWILSWDDGSRFLDFPFIARSFSSLKAVGSPDLSTQATKPKSNFQTTLIQFGILLLELCFGDTLESRMAKRKWDTSQDTQQSALIEYATALDWSTEVQDEFPDFKTPIDRCLKESFGERVDWNNLLFLQTLYMNLVKPLSETVTRNNWDSG